MKNHNNIKFKLINNITKTQWTIKNNKSRNNLKNKKSQNKK